MILSCTNNEWKQKVFLIEPVTLRIWMETCKGQRSHRYPVNLPHVIAGIMWPFQLWYQRTHQGTMHGNQRYIRSRGGLGEDFRMTSRGSDEWGVWGFPWARPVSRTQWKHVSRARNCRVWTASTKASVSAPGDDFHKWNVWSQHVSGG